MFRHSTLLSQSIAARRESPVTGRKMGIFPASQEKSRLALWLEMQAGFQPREDTATFHTSRRVAGDELSPKGGGIGATPV